MSLYDINILVNGNRCKQYVHSGKTFIEAKDGSEYEIEFKNNTYQKVLLVGSVDGLSVMDGKSASEDSSGYVVDPYSSLKIKGFRYSDDEVGSFKFSSKRSSYAASKYDGSEKNVGIIGIRVFDDQAQRDYWNNITRAINGNNFWRGQNSSNIRPYWDDLPRTMCGNATKSTSTGNSIGAGFLRSTSLNSAGHFQDEIRYGSALNSCNYSVSDCSVSDVMTDAESFDMGTSWGSRKESKVREVEFKKGVLVFNTDIYYASRSSLIQMGVPITNETKVHFPQSFPEKYAKPPVGWVG